MKSGDVINVDRSTCNGGWSWCAEQRAHEHVVGALDNLFGSCDSLIASEDEEREDVDEIERWFSLSDKLLRLVERCGFGCSVSVEQICKWTVNSRSTCFFYSSISKKAQSRYFSCIG